MKITPAATLLCLTLAACGPAPQGKLEVTAGANFFENSRRVEAPQDEKRGLGRLGGCTAYFLKNTQDKNFVATARHCFSYNAPNWCPRGVVKDEFSGEQIRCKGIAAGDGKHDLIVFELEDSTRDRSKDFELASFALAPSMRLEMLGFPGDRFNSSRHLKLTQNCWVIEPKTRNIYDDPNVVLDQTFTHNCSTYGGNSGGPMFLEGTRIAVGIPDTYAPNDFSQRQRDQRAAQGVLASGFVADFRAELEAAGISIRASAPTALPANYPTEGHFASNSSSCEAQVKRISYNTHVVATEMVLELFEGCATQSQVTLSCTEAMKCTHASGNVELIWNGANRFELQGENFVRQ